MYVRSDLLYNWHHLTQKLCPGVPKVINSLIAMIGNYHYIKGGLMVLQPRLIVCHNPIDVQK